MAKNENGEAVIKWITVTVLVAVSLFFAVLYKNIFIDSLAQTIEQEQENENGNNNNQEEEEEEEEEDETPAPTVIYSTFPRIAVTSSDGGFINNTGGSGDEELMDVISFGGYYYIILETDSNGRDYKAAKHSIAVAKISAEGTLVAASTLTTSQDEYYLASKICNTGIIIAASYAAGTVYYAVKPDLTSNKALTSDSYTSLKMYYTRDYTLLLGAKQDKMTVSAINDSLVKVFSNTIEYSGSVEIVEVFPSASGFNIAVNSGSETCNSYLTGINYSGDLINKSLIGSSRLLKITPSDSGYTMLELSAESLYLKGISASYTQQFRTLLGEGGGGDFYPLNNGFITFVFGEDGAISKHLCKYGQIITQNTEDFKDVTTIKAFCLDSSGVYFYADVENSGGKDTAIINYTVNNSVTFAEKIAGYYRDTACKIFINGNLLIAFSTSNSVNSVYSGSFGGYDVFITAVALN